MRAQTSIFTAQDVNSCFFSCCLLYAVVCLDNICHAHNISQGLIIVFCEVRPCDIGKMLSCDTFLTFQMLAVSDGTFC